MKKITILLIIVASLLFLSNTVMGVDPLKQPTVKQPDTTVSQPPTQPTQQQKPAIKILNPDIYRLSVKILTEKDLKTLKTQINSIYDDFSNSSHVLSQFFRDYDYRLSYCLDKSYTYEEQQAAGCLPNDTIQQCSQKLLKNCAGHRGLMLKEKSDIVQNKIHELNNKTTELANKLKALSYDLQQKYQ